MTENSHYRKRGLRRPLRYTHPGGKTTDNYKGIKNGGRNKKVQQNSGGKKASARVRPSGKRTYVREWPYIRSLIPAKNESRLGRGQKAKEGETFQNEGSRPRTFGKLGGGKDFRKRSCRKVRRHAFMIRTQRGTNSLSPPTPGRGIRRGGKE